MQIVVCGRRPDVLKLCAAVLRSYPQAVFLDYSLALVDDWPQHVARAAQQRADAGLVTLTDEGPCYARPNLRVSLDPAVKADMHVHIRDDDSWEGAADYVLSETLDLVLELQQLEKRV